MKKSIMGIIAYIFLAFALTTPVFSQDSGPAIDHSGHVGEMVHESAIDGYRFAYHLIDIQKNPEEMKDMPKHGEVDETHHLMVYVMDPNGQPVQQAKLGYLVEGPNGAKQKLMAMGMQGAFGANVDFRIKGSYIIKTKIVTGDKKLFDRFRYEVK
jgi:hypothetical protein